MPASSVVEGIVPDRSWSRRQAMIHKMSEFVVMISLAYLSSAGYAWADVTGGRTQGLRPIRITTFCRKSSASAGKFGEILRPGCTETSSILSGLDFNISATDSANVSLRGSDVWKICIPLKTMSGRESYRGCIAPSSSTTSGRLKPNLSCRANLYPSKVQAWYTIINCPEKGGNLLFKNSACRGSNERGIEASANFKRSSSDSLFASAVSFFAVDILDSKSFASASADAARTLSAATSLSLMVCRRPEKAKTPASPANSPIRLITIIHMNMVLGWLDQAIHLGNFSWSSRYSPITPNANTKPEIKSNTSQELRNFSVVSFKGESPTQKKYPINPYRILGAIGIIVSGLGVATRS